jgi:hypothetical protein
MFVGPLGGLGALRVMNGPSHAKSVRVAKKDRFSVASELVSDVGESRTTSNPNVGDKLRRYTGGVHSVRRRRAASPSNRRTATTAGAAQIFLDAIHHEVRQEV